MDIFSAARLQLEKAFTSFKRVLVSFSRGVERIPVLSYSWRWTLPGEKGRQPLDVLHIDLETWYAHTMSFVTRIMSRPNVHPHWICFPLHLRNSVSQIQSHWKSFSLVQTRNEFGEFVPPHYWNVRGRTFMRIRCGHTQRRISESLPYRSIICQEKRTGGVSRPGMAVVPIPFSQLSALLLPLSFILINESWP